MALRENHSLRFRCAAFSRRARRPAPRSPRARLGDACTSRKKRVRGTAASTTAATHRSAQVRRVVSLKISACTAHIAQRGSSQLIEGDVGLLVRDRAANLSLHRPGGAGKIISGVLGRGDSHHGAHTTDANASACEAQDDGKILRALNPFEERTHLGERACTEQRRGRVAV